MPEVPLRPLPLTARNVTERAPSRRYGRRHGVEIKPGTARKARLEAGLSLAQVAGSDISRTAIYFVETGKAKPSLETLKLIASRTGRPLDYFLSEPSTMEPRSSAGTAEIERLIATGDAAGALASAKALLGAEHNPESVAQIKFLMATAHIRLAQPAQARSLAAAARVYFEQVGDQLMTAECLGNEASAAVLMQDPGALAVVETALATCRSLTPIPRLTEGRLLGILGHVHGTRRNWEAAIHSYKQAIVAGDVVQDLRRLSLMFSGLSVAYQETGELNQAAHYAQRAMAIHETLDDRLSLARSENNLGLMLLRAGDPAKARPHLERSLRLFDETGVEAAKALALLSLSELALAESETLEAARFAHDALDLASRLSEAGSIADAHVWLGRIAAAIGDHRTADAEFVAAFDVLRVTDSSADRSSRAHALYAEILESRGDLHGALEQLKQALASRPAQTSARISATTA